MHQHHTVLIVNIAALLALAGCGGNIAIKKQDLDSIKAPIQVVHRATPMLAMPSTASVILLGVASGLSGGLATAGVVPTVAGATAIAATAATGATMDARSTKAVTQRINADCVIPDAGHAVTDRLVKEWNRQGGAPGMVLVAQPVSGDQTIPGAAIIFTTTQYVRAITGYLVLSSRLEMQNADGKIIFREKLEPHSFYKDYTRTTRSHSRDEFLADRCQILRQEVDNLSQFIAERYVTTMHSQLKRGK